jgi:hypothetical protein
MTTTPRRRALLICALTSAMGCSAVQAHHSFAMFDRASDMVLTGSVKEFIWANPHTYIQLIADKDGQNWSIEAGGLNGLERDNWRRDSLQPGDKITVHIHPLRNGAPGGEMMWVLKPDGTTLSKPKLGSATSGG